MAKKSDYYNKAKKVLTSNFFKKATSQAREYLSDPQKLKNLLNEAATKLEGVAKVKGDMKELADKLKTLFRFVRAYVKGEYRDVSTVNILLAIVAIVYFVMPLDLIPDTIPVGGYIDDLYVVKYAVEKLSTVFEDFSDWEESQTDS